MLRFGAFELDEQRFELRRLGRRIPTPPRVLETLLYLIQHRDRVVTRDELSTGPWQGTTVSDDALAQIVRSVRRVLDDPRGQIVRTVRGKGFRFDAEVVASVDSSERGSVSTKRLFGRAGEIELLERARNDAQVGRGSLTLVCGEAGIGKSRLVEEYAERSSALGIEVLWGRCWEVAGAPALWPWPHLIRTYAERRTNRELRKLGAGMLDELITLCPELGGLLEGAPRASMVVESHETRFRILDAAARFIERAAAAGPLTIVLEDVHVADDASLLLLDFLGRAVGQSRLHLVATCRSMEAQERSLLVAALRGLLPNVTRLTLEGLDQNGVVEWLMTVLGSDVARRSAAVLHRSTAGHPFLIEDALRDGVGTALSRASAHAELRDARLPERIAGTIRARLAALPELTREVLASAAVIGRDFAVVPLAAVHEAVDVSAALDPALLAGLIQRDLEQSDGYHFSHVLLREVLYHDASPTLRLERHLAIGRYLADRLQHDPDLVFQVAHHLALALPRGDRAVALDYALRAAERAQRQLAYELAVQWYERALASLDEIEIDVGLRCKLMLWLGQAQHSANEQQRAVATFASVVELAALNGRDEYFVEGVLAWFEVLQGQSAAELAFQERLKQACAKSVGPGPRARLLAASATAFYFATSPEERRALVAESMKLMRESDDWSALSTIVTVRRSGGVFAATAREEFALATEFVERAEASGNPQILLEARLSRARAAAAIGSLEPFEAEARSHHQLAKKLRSSEHLWSAALIESARAVLAADLNASMKLARESLSMAPAGRDIWTKANVSVYLVPILAELYGAAWEALAGELLQTAREILAEVPGFHGWRAVAALASVSLGDHAEARESLERFVGVEAVDLPRDGNFSETLDLLAVIAMGLGDHGRMQTILRELVVFSGEHFVAGPCAYWGPVSYRLGELHLAVGDAARAAEAFRQALRESREMRAVIWKARSELGLARALRAVEPESVEIPELLESAEAAARRHGLERLLADLAQLEGLAPGGLSATRA